MQQKTLSIGYGFPEGPAQGPDGLVYLVEMGGRAVSRFGPDGKREKLADIDGTPGAVAWGLDGAMYVPNQGNLDFVDGRPRGASEGNVSGSIDRVTRDGVVTCLYRDCGDELLIAPNDIVFDPEGGFYFTDSEHGDFFQDPIQWPKGRVFWAAADGSEIRKVATDYELPNGIAIKNDGKTLLVCETLTFTVWAHDIRGPGEVGPRRLYAKLPDGHMPDGCAVDSDDHLVVAAVRAGALVHFGPDGDLIKRIPTEDTDVTNCCFIGDQRTTLIATEGFLGRVVAFEWERPGMVPFPERQWT